MNRRHCQCLVVPLLAAVIIVCSACDEGSQSSGVQGPPVATAASAHEHPEGMESCFICDAAQREPGRLWCREHDRYEDRCWLCHPELRDDSRLYCDEHGLYEDECFLCDPSRAKGSGPASEASPANDGQIGLLRLQSPGRSDGLYCAEHDVNESECAICHPELAESLRPGESLKIRFASSEGPRKAGVRTAPARTVTSTGAIDALVESAFDGNRLARITPLTPGVVQKALVDVGDRVVAGDPLLELHSNEIAAAKAELLSAQVALQLAEDTLRRESVLREQNISAEQDYRAAEAAHRSARIELMTARHRLVNFGMTPDEVAVALETEDGSATIVLRAPFDGEIVQREAVIGEAASPGAQLLTLADRSVMWLELSIDADAVSRLEVGAPVRARFASLPGETFVGRVVWIDASIDPRSRLLRARAVTESPDPRLKAGLFGEATVEVSVPAEVIRVPRDAVQHVSGLPYVFVRIADDLFDARRVELAGLTDQEADIATGLAPGESVAVTGAFTVMSEMLKARLGAGCVH